MRFYTVEPLVQSVLFVLRQYNGNSNRLDSGSTFQNRSLEGSKSAGKQRHFEMPFRILLANNCLEHFSNRR